MMILMMMINWISNSAPHSLQELKWMALGCLQMTLQGQGPKQPVHSATHGNVTWGVGWWVAFPPLPTAGRTASDCGARPAHCPAGKFDAEIVPVATAVKDQSGAKTPVTVAQDDGPRSTPYESLAKVLPSSHFNFHTGGGSVMPLSKCLQWQILTSLTNLGKSRQIPTTPKKNCTNCTNAQLPSYSTHKASFQLKRPPEHSKTTLVAWRDTSVFSSWANPNKSRQHHQNLMILSIWKFIHSNVFKYDYMLNICLYRHKIY